MIFIIDLRERYQKLKEEAIYEDYKKEVKNIYECEKKSGNLTRERDIVLHACFFNIHDYENLIRDCIPDRIMIYFAMEMFCIEHDVVLDEVHDVVIEMVKAKQIYMNKRYFHENDYDLLCEDKKVIKNRFNL